MYRFGRLSQCLHLPPAPPLPPAAAFSSSSSSSTLTGAFRDRLSDFLSPSRDSAFLDLTFGEGGHSRHLLSLAPGCRLVAADCHLGAFRLARRLQQEHPDGGVTALRARFSQVPAGLLHDVGLPLHHFDAVVLDPGPNGMHVGPEGVASGLDLARNGRLDLRLDPDAAPDAPTAADVLRTADDYAMHKIFRHYGGMTGRVKAVVNAIMEGRYMFKEYRTLEELASVLGEASSKLAERENGADEVAQTRRLLADAVRALRTFVNDEYNELDFAVRVVAENFLKPHTGVLFAITRSNQEEKIVRSVLSGKDIPAEAIRGDGRLGEHQAEDVMEKHPWNLLTTEPILLEDNSKSSLLSNRKKHKIALHVAVRTDHLRRYESGGNLLRKIN